VTSTLNGAHKDKYVHPTYEVITFILWRAFYVSHAPKLSVKSLLLRVMVVAIGRRYP